MGVELAVEESGGWASVPADAEMDIGFDVALGIGWWRHDW